MNRITLYHQDVPITHYPIETNTFSIGRSPENDLILAGQGVAERHCIVFRKADGTWRARPLDGNAPARETPLEPGRRLALGPYAFALEIFPNSDNAGPNPANPVGSEQHNLGIIGTSPQTQLLKSDISRIAPLGAPVLITGETGTGKELAAGGLHLLSKHHDGPFVAINCGCFTDTLLEDTLFGHEPGAFTGASRPQKGIFEQAVGGTLFLDEIGELPLKQQATLLRVLENKVVRRIGSNLDLPVNFRLVAATNCNLDDLIGNGLFRRDLYHRIATLSIRLAPLRERPQDITPLCSHFLSGLEDEMGRRQLSTEALQKMRKYSWPGNVRELRNALYRAAALSDGYCLRPTDFQLDSDFLPLKPRPFRLDEISRAKLEILLKDHNGNVTATARTLGIPRTSLRDRIARLDKD